MDTEIFDPWRRAVKESTEAWVRAMGQAAKPPQPPLPDFTEFWRPLLAQGMELWQKAAAEGGLTPEFMQQWKALMDQWIETWSKVLGQAMATDEFAQALGRYLDQWLAAQAPLRKGMEQYTDTALRTLGLPSRQQVVGLASQVVGLEERIEGLEDRLDELRKLLLDVARAVADHEAAAERRATQPREGP